MLEKIRDIGEFSIVNASSFTLWRNLCVLFILFRISSCNSSPQLLWFNLSLTLLTQLSHRLNDVSGVHEILYKEKQGTVSEYIVAVLFKYHKGRH
jgi:hypothetical protein